MILLIISFVLFLVYLIAIFIMDRAPHSISDSFYLFNIRKKGLGHVFTLWSFAMMILLAIQLFEASADRWFQFTALFAAAGLGFVGAAPYFKHNESKIHSISAYICAGFGVIWMSFMGFYWVPAILLGLVAIRYHLPKIVGKLKDKMIDSRFSVLFWAEVAIFTSIFIVLFLIIRTH